MILPKDNNLKNNKLCVDLVEIFSSMQGEGFFLGAKQIFVRFAGCNLNCLFCDTVKDAYLEGLDVDEVLEKVKFVDENYGPHHSISLTGGEPLIYADFLEKFLPKLKEAGYKIYLETNGTLHDELKRIIDYVDIIAMDFKLPSSTKEDNLWAKHVKFLKIARKKQVFIKMVITGDTVEKDVLKARNIIQKIDKTIMLVLQPVSPINGAKFSVPKRDSLDKYLHLCEDRLQYVRVIPQIQKFMEIK